jgi:Ca2+-transporting ATPase
VLGVARGRGTEERDLELLGVLGIADPPRREAIEAVRAARDAGVTTVMITGDHRATALAIARELDIVRTSADEDERVHARATPEDKLRIVRRWKERGAIVAMTGDGVNDAPALREADIGIAMGKSGTEVTREASDMVLADDNFASIVAAMREGRGIYENVRKTLVYLLAGNFGEIVLVFGATLLGFPPPLLPLHLLYINLVTDGLPALALVADPTPEDALAKPPRPTDEPILGRSEWLRVVGMGLLEASFAITLFVHQARHQGLEHARALVFTYVVFAEIFRALVARSRDRLFLETKPSTNVPLIAVVAGSFALQLALVASPFFARLFGLVRVGAEDIALALGLALTSCGLLDLTKLVTRRSLRVASRPVVSAGELRPPREEPHTQQRRG